MHSVIHKIIFITLLTITFQTNAASPTVTVSASPTPLNQIMSEIGKTMVELFPLIMAKRAMTDSEKNRMQRSVFKLFNLFQKAGPYIKRKSDTYQVSYDYVLDYLHGVTLAFEKKEPTYARSQLYALGSICASCHTQDTKLRTLFSGTKRDQFSSDIAYAEFNFITRNYSEAIKFYDKHLTSKQKKTEFAIAQPLQRIITIYAQIYNKPGEGAKQLEKYLTLEKHTHTTKNHLAKWITGLKNLEAQGAKNVVDTNFSTLEKYVKQNFGNLDKPLASVISTPEEEISLVWLRGQLYRYLNNKPKKSEIPVIIFWLALSDRSIGYNFYFSLADLYLKECIIKHPEHPYARRCLAEYKEYIRFSHTGSSGTFIPPKLQQELDELEQRLQLKQPLSHLLSEKRVSTAYNRLTGRFNC